MTPPRVRADEPRGSVPLGIMREPATLLARPSALATSRLAWVVLTAPLAVLVAPNVAQWVPWWAGPLLVGCVLDAGLTSAIAWLLAGLVLTSVLPPGGAPVAAELAGGLAAVFVAQRLSGLAAATGGAPFVLGALTSLVHDAALVLWAAASSGRLGVDLLPLVIRAAGTGLLAAFVLPSWLAWASRERSRGRA